MCATQDVIPIQREFGDFVPRGDEQFVSLTRKKKAAGVIPATLCPIVAPTMNSLDYETKDHSLTRQHAE